MTMKNTSIEHPRVMVLDQCSLIPRARGSNPSPHSAAPLPSPHSVAPLPSVRLDTDLRDLLPGYFERRSQEVATIPALFARGEMNRLATMAHNLKGSGTSYGEPELSALGVRLEAALARGDATQILALHGRLTRYLAGLAR